MTVYDFLLKMGWSYRFKIVTDGQDVTDNKPISITDAKQEWFKEERPEVEKTLEKTVLAVDMMKMEIRC